MIALDSINQKCDDFILIDYVNAKKSTDWIFSIAKMFHYWDFMFLIIGLFAFASYRVSRKYKYIN